jgi:hypothetical protein
LPGLAYFTNDGKPAIMIDLYNNNNNTSMNSSEFLIDSGSDITCLNKMNLINQVIKIEGFEELETASGDVLATTISGIRLNLDVNDINNNNINIDVNPILAILDRNLFGQDSLTEIRARLILDYHSKNVKIEI